MLFNCRVRWLPVLVVILGFAASLPARAQVIIYHDEASFFAQAGNISTATFDEAKKNYSTKQIEIDGVIYEAPDHLNLGALWSQDSTFGSKTAPNSLIWTGLDTHTITFDGGQSVHAFGFWLLSPNAPGTPNNERPRDYTIGVQDANALTTNIQIENTVSSLQQYIGFTSATGIRQVQVMPTPGLGVVFNWAYDNVTVSATVPEPGTYALLASTCFAGAVFAVSRLKRKGASS